MTDRLYMETREPVAQGLASPLALWAGSRTSYPRDKTIATLFEEAAAVYADKTALIFGDARLTYGELNRRANVLAHELVSMGAGPEKMVGLCAERSTEMIVGMIAILKSGAAYVPFDPSYPAERLAFMVNDTNIEIMLAQENLLRAMTPSREFKTVLLQQNAFESFASEDANPPSRAAAANLAYVMYTSGSTGLPKGVMIENRSVIRLVFETNFCNFGPDEIFLQYAPISFDASTFEIWGALLHGSALVLMPPQASSLRDIGDTIRKHGVTTMWLTAGLFHVFVDQRLEDLRPLRQLLAGGDVLMSGKVHKVLEQLHSTTLINGYGPTEGTTFTCCHVMRCEDVIGDRVPIGRPISNSFVYLLNENLEPVGVGEVGELVAGGDGIARGYLNSPELSAEKFLPDPYAKSAGARMYRTGDLGRWLPDGTLEFLGRRDNQVKILGHRIELGEIEAILAHHPAMRQVCVVASTDELGNRRLVAYYVANSSVTIAELKEFLASKLPAYMVPAFYFSMSNLPLNPNGKVDRAALPDPAASGGAELRTTGSELEEQIAELWKQALGTQRIGLDDNFFDLGGDSLLIVAVHSQLQKMLQREIQVTDLFEYVTVRSLARHLAEIAPATPAFSAAQEQARKQREAQAKRRAMRSQA